MPKTVRSLTESILSVVRQWSETKLIKCKVAPEYSFTLQMNRKYEGQTQIRLLYELQFTCEVTVF